MIMTREEAFERLWDELREKGGVEEDPLAPHRGMTYEGGEVFVEIEEEGAHYELEVFIAVEGAGFTTVDIYVLLDDVEDHSWCWEQLNKIGITEEIFEV